MIRNWLSKPLDGMHISKDIMNDQNRLQRDIVKPVNDQKEDMAKFLDSLPKLPFHYCRQSTDKLYVESVFGNNKSAIYVEYQKWCAKFFKAKPLSNCSFSKMVNEKKIAFQQPKKDQCDECCSFKAGNLSEEVYNEHIFHKEKAREEKANDKQRGERGECIVLTQDLQAVKVCPMLNASALYYKTKLCCHNFTVYNVNTHNARCYWFTEIDADLNATTFASCVIDNLKEIYQEGKPIIIWSDGCGYQNKNCTLANALLSFAVEKQIIVEQKFLEKGHTQMEADSVHATIERHLKNKPIYVPNDYCEYTVKARKNPKPYEIKRLSFDFVKNYDDNLIYSSIRPGRRVGDPTVNNIKNIKYTPDGEIKVKLAFDSDFVSLPQRKKRDVNINRLEDFMQKRSSAIKIKHQKWVHLQQLKSVIPKDFHPFYDNISFLSDNTNKS